jgi:LPXTG-motif cell wall-anchored protein
MRYLPAALLAIGVTLACHTTAEAAAPPEIVVRYGWPSAVVPNGGGIDLGTTTPGDPFTVALTFANEGADGSALHVTSLLVSGGLTLVQDLPAAIDGGASAVMLIQCNATGTYTGTIAFNTDDPGESYYEIDLACSNTSSGAPGLRVVNSSGKVVPNGGGVYAEPGSTAVLHIFNDAGGKQPLKFGEPQSSLDGPRVLGFQPDDTVAADGLPVSLSVVCENGDEEPLTGIYPITLADVLNETNYTFSLYCGVPLADSGDGLPKTGAPSTWTLAAALGLLAAGLGLRSFARREA